MQKYIRIKSEEQSRREQEKLFAKGYRWVNTGVGYWRIPANHHIELDTELKLMYSCGAYDLPEEAKTSEIKMSEIEI